MHFFYSKPLICHKARCSNGLSTFKPPKCLLSRKKGYQIYSSTGQLVKQSSHSTTQITISDLPTGFYILKIEEQVGRFIKTE
jgi:hypothetical protein